EAGAAIGDDGKVMGTEKIMPSGSSSDQGANMVDDEPEGHKSMVGPRPEGRWYEKQVLWWGLKYAVLHGVDKDVVGSQSEKSVMAGDVEELHTRAKHFDNKAEYLYTFLQVMTAATASFTHGANDVAK